MKKNIVKVDNAENKSISKNNKDMPKLTLMDIKKYINPLVTDKEAYMFLQLCKSQNLNPFIKEAYLIKYNTDKPATMVVGKDVFTKRASHLPQFNGFKAGVIILNKNNIVYREGSLFIRGSEQLIGGWAEVYRKDREVPFRNEVSMQEYNTNQSSWQQMPATMIRKVALVQALREAFPDDFGGLYDAAEMGVELTDTSDTPENISNNTNNVENHNTIELSSKEIDKEIEEQRKFLMKKIINYKIELDTLKQIVYETTGLTTLQKASVSDLITIDNALSKMQKEKEIISNVSKEQNAKDVLDNKATDISDITDKVDWLKETPTNNFETPIDDDIPFSGENNSLDKDLTASLF